MNEEVQHGEGDYARDLVRLLFSMTGFPLPPYLLEIVLDDGRSFYIHSPNQHDEETDAVILNVYDFRAIGPAEDLEIKRKLDQMGAWDPAINLSQLHPLLSVGRLRCNIRDIAYVVEWWARYWTLERFIPDAKRGRLGFDTD